MKSDELASKGISAYQMGSYDIAIEWLSLLVEREPKLWTCRLYLAMACLRAGEEKRGRHELTTIADCATDQSVKKKAIDALRALNAGNATNSGH